MIVSTLAPEENKVAGWLSSSVPNSSLHKRQFSRNAKVGKLYFHSLNTYPREGRVREGKDSHLFGIGITILCDNKQLKIEVDKTIAT